jgi:hypothetical protein
MRTVAPGASPGIDPGGRFEGQAGRSGQIHDPNDDADRQDDRNRSRSRGCLYPAPIMVGTLLRSRFLPDRDHAAPDSRIAKRRNLTRVKCLAVDFGYDGLKTAEP